MERRGSEGLAGETSLEGGIELGAAIGLVVCELDWNGDNKYARSEIVTQYQLYLLCRLRGRTSAEFPGEERWQCRSRCLG